MRVVSRHLFFLHWVFLWTSNYLNLWYIFSLLLLLLYYCIHDIHPSIFIAYSPSGHGIPYTRESTRLASFFFTFIGDTSFEYWFDRFSGMISDFFWLLIWYRMLCGDILVLSSLFLSSSFCGTKLCQNPCYGLYMYIRQQDDRNSFSFLL